MSSLSVKHLIAIKDLQADDLQLIIKTADNFKEVLNRPIKKYHHSEILPLPIFF